MLYLTGSIPASPELRAELRTMGVGVMAQPRSYSAATINGWPWAADNGAFADNWDADGWFGWLQRMSDVPGCMFAVVPDRVGDAVGTRRLWDVWSGRVASLGYQLAYVAQDGQQIDDVPWGEIACLFVGGSTAWKLSAEAEAIVRHARSLGVWVHMGRVNSARRMRIAESWGVNSCDGTFLAFGPDANVPRLQRMINEVRRNPSLFGVQP